MPQKSLRESHTRQESAISKVFHALWQKGIYIFAQRSNYIAFLVLFLADFLDLETDRDTEMSLDSSLANPSDPRVDLFFCLMHRMLIVVACVFVCFVNGIHSFQK